MDFLISVPSGYNAREILLPLQPHLTSDPQITAIHVISPAAHWHTRLFPHFGKKFHWYVNPTSQSKYDALLKKIKPDVIITPTIGLDLKDTPLIRAAKKINIPTLTFVASWDNVFKMERLMRHGHSGTDKHQGDGYAIPDHFAVWNKLNRDHLLRIFPHLSPANITITGPPRFDYFAQTENIPSRTQLLSYLGFIDPHTDAPLIHLATTELYPFDYIVKQIHRAIVAKTITKQPLLYSSVHPGGNIANHLAYQKYNVIVRYSFGRRENSPHPDFAYLPSTKEIFYLVALFKHSNLLINQSSTVTVESMRCDVPIINVKYGRRFDLWRWRRSMVYRDFQQHYRYITDEQATTIINHPRQLVHAINDYLLMPNRHHDERARTIKKIITYTDGSSSLRLINCAKKII